MSDRKEHLLKLLAKEPSDTFLRFALAMEHAKLGQTDDALAQFDRVLELDPAYVAAWMQKAGLAEQLRQFDLAKATYRAGIEAALARGDHHSASKMRESLDRLVRATGSGPTG